MINGPLIGGFMIALVLIFSAVFAGSWFHSAVEFSDAHTLDAARTTKPVVCSFKTDEFGDKTSGTIHARDGIMRFDIHNNKNGEINNWGVEINMADASMMSQAGPEEPFVSMDNYPDLRVQIIEDLKKIIHSDALHCAPWWSARSFRFNLEGHL